MNTAKTKFISLCYSFQIKISHILHIATILLLLCSIFAVGTIQYLCQTEGQHQTTLNAVDKYGRIGFIVLFCLKLIPCLSIPFTVMNIIALTFTNVWTEPPKGEILKSYVPFMCFRVVTKGLYTNLVKNSLERNIETCQRTGLDKFKFEVVTDIPLELNTSKFVREIVVPKNYSTKNNSLYKARALHYCLEKGVNIISDDDWIVHLDEETLLTQGSVVGLANFAAKEMGSIGQGVITYANDGIVNWWTTLADSFRVAIDIGLMKFCLQRLHRPIYGLKGSYIIIKASVEKYIGFDYGPQGSIAEDLYFALEAWKNGYKFNFVEGEMWEKSPFTIFDYIRQRKRWFVGRMFTLLNRNIPIKYKLFLIPADLSWLLLIFNIIGIFITLETPTFIVVINSCTGGLIVFLFILGSIQSFSLKRYGLLRKIIICVWTVLIIPYVACLDGIASVCGFLWRNDAGFYIIKKEHIQHPRHVQVIA